MEFVTFMSAGLSFKYTFAWGVLDAQGHKHFTSFDVDAWQPTHGYQLWFPDPTKDSMKATKLMRRVRGQASPLAEGWEQFASILRSDPGTQIQTALEIVAINEKPGSSWEHDNDSSTLWIKED